MPELRARWKRVGLHYNGFWKCVIEAVGLVGETGVKIARNRLELRKSGWGVALYDEFFLNFGHNVASNVFDQNRAYAAVTHTLGKASRLELGYMNQIVQQRNGRIFENNCTLQVAVFSTLALRNR